MSSNKNRLYVALYPSGVVNNDERKYHWGFFIGPKAEKGSNVPGMRYHVKNRPVEGWVYEEMSLTDVRTTNSLLARILIAKVEDEERLIKIFRSIPIVQNDPNWRCRSWVARALEFIAEDRKAVGTSQLDWEKIEATAREYVGQMTTSGRYQKLEDLMGPKPTYDMLQGMEVVP